MAVRFEQGNDGKMVPGSSLDDPPEMHSITRSGKVIERGTKRHGERDKETWR